MSCQFWWPYEASKESTITFSAVLDWLFVEAVFEVLDKWWDEAVPIWFHQNISQGCKVIFWSLGSPVEFSFGLGLNIEYELAGSEHVVVYMFVYETANYSTFNIILVFVKLSLFCLFIYVDKIFFVQSHFLGGEVVPYNHILLGLGDVCKVFNWWFGLLDLFLRPKNNWALTLWCGTRQKLDLLIKRLNGLSLSIFPR